MSAQLPQIIFSGESMKMDRPLKYTGVRIAQFEAAKAIRKSLGAAEYAKVIRTLNRKEEVARVAREKREAAAEKKYLAELAIAEAAKEAKQEAARIKRNLKAKERRAAKRDATVVVDIKTKPISQGDSDLFDTVVKAPIVAGLQKVVGQTTAYLQFSLNGDIVKSKLIEIHGGDGESIYWNSVFRHLLLVGSEGLTIFNAMTVGKNFNIVPLNPDDDLRFVILKATTVPPAKIQQKYREGLTHCILEPLYILWNKMSENSESDASRKRCRQVANRIKNLESVYPEGVPQGVDMEVVARVANRCIVIHDFLGKVIERYNVRARKFFRFTNTRLNHVEAGVLAWDGEFEKVSQEQMNQLIFEHDRDDIFYLYGGDINRDTQYNDVHDNACRSLRSVKGAYAVFNADYEIFKEFSKSVGINNYGIDAVKFPLLNKFLLESRIINSAPTPLCDAPNDIDDANHLDLEKAYAQHKNAPNYKGFLGHITDWARVDADPSFLTNHVGVFQFKVLSCSNSLLEKLGIYAGNEYILPSPEIEYMISLGVEVALYAGCWGSTFDIEYTPEMLAERRYCTWAGKLGMDNPCDTYTFRGDAGWAACLKNMIGEESVHYYRECSMIVVRIPKKSYMTRHHILSFITSYTRMNMINSMTQIEESGGELIKVILDGIYYRGEVVDIEIPHKNNKDMKRHIGFRDTWYNPVSNFGANAVGTDAWAQMDTRFDIPADKIQNVVVLTGAGGTGKSHSVLQNLTIPKVLYVVPTHILGRKMKAKTGCEYTTIHKLIGIRQKEGSTETEKTRSYRDEFKEPACIFIDELTMIEKSWIDRAIEMYPNSKIFVAGDVDTNQWFQCRNGYTGNFSEVWMPTAKHHIVDYTVDYRAKDQALKDLKLAIRAEMKRIFTGESVDIARMRMFIKDYISKNPCLQSCSFEEGASMFLKGDIWIAGTQKTNTRLLEMGVVSGYINKFREVVTEEEDGAEKRGSFTTHSFQGLTLETERVFISLDFFEYAMLYTSISRVCNINQLVIIV
jgi:hypothetical protein